MALAKQHEDRVTRNHIKNCKIRVHRKTFDCLHITVSYVHFNFIFFRLCHYLIFFLPSVNKLILFSFLTLCSPSFECLIFTSNVYVKLGQLIQIFTYLFILSASFCICVYVGKLCMEECLVLK